METGREDACEAEMEALLQEYVEMFNERARALQLMVDEVFADAFGSCAGGKESVEAFEVDSEGVAFELQQKFFKACEGHLYFM